MEDNADKTWTWFGDFAASRILYGEQHSSPYISGAFALGNYLCYGVHIHCPHAAGTSWADAFNAGIDRGYALWREWREMCCGAAQAEPESLRCDNPPKR